jgi:class 3 adenylate cyclase
VDSKYRPYDHLAGVARIDGYFAQSLNDFKEVDELPDREALTYANGFYAQYCTAMFVDIRDSSKLPNVYKRPALARIYRAYISEVVAVMNGVPKVHEVNIVGDGVWAVFNARNQSDNDEVAYAAWRVNSVVKLLNYKMIEAGYATPIRVGIGVADGRALMIKAGYNGSGIADVVYMGQVVNRAAKLAALGSKGSNPPIFMDSDFVQWLNDDNRALVTYDYHRDAYTASAINVAMNDWFEEHCT